MANLNDCSSIVLAGIAQACETNAGGIKVVWLTQYAAGAASVDSSTNMISEVTLPASHKWYRYEFRRNTGSLTSTLTADETTGINYITNELSLVFSKMDTAKRMEMAALATGHCMAIVQDCNDHFWFIGKDDYVAASAGVGATGTNKTDQNAYTLTLSSEEQSYPYEVAKAVTDTLPESNA